MTQVPPPPPTSAYPVPPPPQNPDSGGAKRKPHVLGIIAFVTAVVGFVFACIPGALILGWILLPIAFILSLVALFLQGSKWPAVTGLILAIVGTVVAFVVFFAVVANAAHDAFGDADVKAGADTSTSAPEVAAADGDEDAASPFVVTIDGSTQTTDYQGNPALIVDFTFTNNSDKDANFMFALRAQAFQNGVELDPAILTDPSFDSGAALRDIKPGATTQVQVAFALADGSDVTIEVKELMSLDDSLLATKDFALQ